MCVCAFRVPTDEQGGEMKQRGTGKCFDTLGHEDGGEVGLYMCHGNGGNQVSGDSIYSGW